MGSSAVLIGSVFRRPVVSGGRYYFCFAWLTAAFQILLVLSEGSLSGLLGKLIHAQSYPLPSQRRKAKLLLPFRIFSIFCTLARCTKLLVPTVFSINLLLLFLFWHSSSFLLRFSCSVPCELFLNGLTFYFLLNAKEILIYFVYMYNTLICNLIQYALFLSLVFHILSKIASVNYFTW